MRSLLSLLLVVAMIAGNMVIGAADEVANEAATQEVVQEETVQEVVQEEAVQEETVQEEVVEEQPQENLEEEVIEEIVEPTPSREGLLRDGELGENPFNLQVSGKWKTSGETLNPNAYDTVQTADNILVAIAFDTDLAYTDKTVVINIPKGISVVTYSTALGSSFLSNLTVTGGYNNANGTTLTYTLTEGISGKAAIEVELKNNPTAAAASNSATIYAPGSIIPISTTYSYKFGEAAGQTVIPYELKVKDFAFMMDFVSGVHGRGGNQPGSAYSNYNADVGAADNYWTEAEALTSVNGSNQSILGLLEISEEEIGLSRQSGITALEIDIPLPDGFSYEGTWAPYKVSGANQIDSCYTTEYDALTNSIKLTMNVGSTGLIQDNTINYSNQDGTTACSRQQYVYKVSLAAILKYENAVAGASYTADTPITMKVIDVGGNEHTYIGENFTVNTYSRDGAYSIPTLGNQTAYVGNVNTNQTIVSYQLTNGSFESRPMLNENAKMRIEIPDGMYAKSFSFNAFDGNPIKTPSKVTIQYKLQSDSDNSYHEMAAWATWDTNNYQGVTVDLTGLSSASDVVTEVLLSFDQFGTFASAYATTLLVIPTLTINGVPNTEYRDGTVIVDGDKRNGKVSFSSDQQAEISKNYTFTYKVPPDKLNIFAASCVNNSSETAASYGWQIWGTKILKSESPSNGTKMDVYINNPTGAMEHTNAYVTIKPENDVKIIRIGRISTADGLEAEIKLSNNETVVVDNISTAGYTPPSGVFIEEVKYHISVIKASLDTGSGGTNALRIPVYIWARHEGEYPLDGSGKMASSYPGYQAEKLENGTNLISASLYSDQRVKEDAATCYGELQVIDTLEYWGIYSQPGYGSNAQSSPTFATPGDGQKITMTTDFNIAADKNMYIVNNDLSSSEYGLYLGSINLYYRLEKSFTYLPGNVKTTTSSTEFGYGATVEDYVIEEYFDNGDSLVVMKLTDFVPYNIQTRSKLNIDFVVQPKVDAKPGMVNACPGMWFEIPDEVRGVVVENPNGKAHSLLLLETAKVPYNHSQYSEGYRSESAYKDIYDINQNDSVEDYIGKQAHNNSINITLNPRKEEGVFNYGASESDPSLSAQEHRGWADETFVYQLNVISQLGENNPLTNFVSYIPIASTGDAKNSAFSFVLDSWPDLDALGFSNDYVISWTTSMNPNMNELTGGTDSGYSTDVPTAKELSQITMIKITADKIEANSNDFIPFDLVVKGEKPSGNPTAYMYADFTYDELTTGGGVGQTTAVPYTLETAKVSGLVWVDEDGDSAYTDGTDSVLSGAKIEIYASDELTTALATTTSGDEGTYELEVDLDGEYIIKVTCPSEKLFVTKGADSVVDATTGKSDEITLGTTTVTDQNIGLYTKKYGYTVNYYKDSVSSDNKLGSETGTTNFLKDAALTAVDIASDLEKSSTSWLDLYKPAEGYESGSIGSQLPFTITNTETNNVINVIYNKSTYSYTIEYYFDNVKDDTKTVNGTGTYGDKILSSNPSTTIKKGNKNYALEIVDGKDKTIKAAATDNIVKVYYALDEVGTDPEKPGKPDGVPDKYQVKVTYTAVSGTITLGNQLAAVSRYTYVTLFAADGITWDVNGTGALASNQIPTTAGNTGYKADTPLWDTEPTTAIVITEDVKYTATWVLANYTVKYDVTTNGGSGSISDQVLNYDQKANLKGFADNSCSAGKGKRFIGWNPNKDASFALYSDKQEVLNLVGVPGGTITLYAIYAENDSVLIQYKSADANMGRVMPASESVMPLSGTVGGSSANAENGYEFVCWRNDETGGIVSTSPLFKPRKVNGLNVTGSYTAYFRALQVDAPTLRVTKVWEDNKNSAGARPASVTVNLYRNGEQVSRATLNAGNSWTARFTNVPKETVGETYSYTVREQSVAGYSASYSRVSTEWTVINTYNSGGGTTPGGETPEVLERITTSETPIVEKKESDDRIEAQTGKLYRDLLDGNVPLGNTSLDGVWSFLNLIMSLVALLIGIITFITLINNLRRRKEEEEDEEGEERQVKADEEEEEEDEQKRKRFAIMKILTAISGLVPAILFFILEDLTLPVAFINKWTPIIGLFFIIHLIVFIVQLVLWKGKKEDEEDKEDIAYTEV